MDISNKSHQPIPEITFRVIIIGVVLTIVLAAANAYLGLKVGQTISASIPAAIISMSVLKFFRDSNVLESTMVQTMASVGESLIAGIAYILPSLIILHAWDGFYYWQTVVIALLGGILGVLFTIPLRRALLIDKTLRYPEGAAISNVLKVSIANGKSDLKFLSWGGAVGAVIVLFQVGFQVLTDSFNFWLKTTNFAYGFSLGLSPALIAAGYIVGINIAISFLVGIFIGWLAGVPILSGVFGMPPITNNTDMVMAIYQGHIRYIGVGTMLIGACWTLVTLVNPITQSIFSSFEMLKKAKEPGALSSIRTERDIPINYVFWAVIFLFIPIFILLINYILPVDNLLSSNFRMIICGFCTTYILVGGFLFCSISAYFAGLIGSSNTPVSGLLVSSLLLLCLALLAFFNIAGGIHHKEIFGIVLGVGSCAVMSVAIAISNDTMQDLKVGQVLGATPWKQQVILIMGVLAAAFIVPPILDLLYNAYGIGNVFPHPGMNPAHMLSAPQATLMATVAQGIFTHHLAWNMIFIGGVVAVICIVIDGIMKKFNMRLPVLAVGLGIYLPMTTTIPVVIGGLLSYIIQRRLNKKYPEENEKMELHSHRGLLLACGIVAGASVMGVILAIPFAIAQSSDALKIMPDQFQPFVAVLSLVVIFALCSWIYRVVVS